MRVWINTTDIKEHLLTRLDLAKGLVLVIELAFADSFADVKFCKQLMSSQHLLITDFTKFPLVIAFERIVVSLGRGPSTSLGANFRRKFALSLIHFFKEHLLGLPTDLFPKKRFWLERQKSEDCWEQLEYYLISISGSSDFWCLCTGANSN